MTYPQVTTAAEFDNPGRVFLWAKANSVKTLEFGGAAHQSKTDALGGLASPLSAIVGLSSIAGPVSGPANVSIEKAVGKAVSNVFDPNEFFGEAKLLGGIKLASVVHAATASGIGAAPKFRSAQKAGDAVTTFDWETALKATSMFIPNADGSSGSLLRMQGKVVTPGGAGSAPTREAFATLDNFKVNLFGFIVLWFDELTFDAKRGRSPTSRCSCTRATTRSCSAGRSSSSTSCASSSRANGFSDPPTRRVTPSGISARATR